MKKRIALVLGIVTVGCLLNIGASETTPVGKLKYSRFSVQHFETGQLKRCKLSGTHEIAGFQCQRWLHFYENGKIRQLQLAKTASIQKVPVAAGSTVFFHENGRLKQIWFADDTTIDGLTVRGGAKISTSFHTNGKVAACFLRDETVIDGVPCDDSVFKPVFLHANGKLKQASLSKAITVNGIAFKKGAEIRLDEKAPLCRAPENEARSPGGQRRPFIVQRTGLLQEIVVAAGILPELAVVHMDNPFGELLDEVDIMGNEDQGTLETLQGQDQ